MIILRIEGTDCSLSEDELTIDRIIAEAHAVGYGEFNVFCNDDEITTPDEFQVTPGATYTIIPVEDDIEISEENMNFEITQDIKQEQE